MGFIHPYERPNSYIGRTLPRSRAMRAVAGRGKYSDDISLPRTLHAAFVRSPYAHAKIRNINTVAAKSAPGVKLVMTGAELAEMCTGPWIGTLKVFDNMKAEPQYPMAVDRACWHPAVRRHPCVPAAARVGPPLRKCDGYRDRRRLPKLQTAS